MKIGGKRTWFNRILAMVMLAAMLSTTVFAVYNAPQSGYSMDADDDNVLKVAAYRAAQVSVEILGADLVATLNMGGQSSTTSASANAAMGIFGSDINESPDPYMYNFFYNYANYGMSDVEGSWTATPFTIAGDIIYGLGQGSPAGDNDTTAITINLGGVTKTTTTAFFQEADIIVGSGDSTAFADVLAAYQQTYNQDYNPTFVSYQGSVGTLISQCENLIEMAKTHEAIMAETAKTTRYESKPLEIATDYDKYVRGIYYYVLSEIADGNLTKQVVAMSPTYDSDSGVWTLSNKTDRPAQYCADISTDMYTMLGGNGTDDITITSAELAQYADVAYSTNVDVRGILSQAGVSSTNMPRVFTTLPACIYGMTMNTHENGMGIAYMASYLYYDQDADLNPANMIAYFVQNFYHVTDNNAIKSVVAEMLQSATVPDGVSASLSGYNKTDVESLIIKGIEYAAEIGADWDPDMTIGIGSKGEDTVPTFSDVEEGKWYYDVITYAAKNGIVNGYEDSTFRPENEITRAEFATILYNYSGKSGGDKQVALSKFSDLKDIWYGEAIGWAVANNVVKGYEDGTFRPDNKISREEAVTMLYNYFSPEGNFDSGTYNSFPDKDKVQSYAMVPMTWATSQQVINGIPVDGVNNLVPQGVTTRAQATTMLVNYIQGLE